MRVLIIFNHPAPYKVCSFNELAKYVDLTVLFERNKVSERPDSFYSGNKYEFKSITLTKGYVGDEGSISSEVRKYIKNHHSEYDVILMNGYSHLAEIKAIKYLSRHHIRFGLLINGGVIRKHEFFLKKAYKKSIIKKADYYISPSQESNKYLIHYGAKPIQIYNYFYSNYSKNDISIASKEEKNQIRKNYQLPLDKKIFINPCQFIERKNNLYLMSFFKNRDDVLLLVGSGKLQNQYEQYIKDNHLDNIRILPFMEKKDLFELYKACDAHITLSKEDIFGHTVLESFSNGVPVISSNKVISSLEYVKNGYNGYIVDNDKPEEISSALDQVNDSMAKNALESAYQNTFENTALSIYEILKKLYE